MLFVSRLLTETLKFYASHMADISFAKAKEKFKPAVQILPQESLVKQPIPIDDDDDFGDPDADVIPPPEKPEIPMKPKLQEKPAVLPKPKPAIKEKPKLSNKTNDEEDAEALEKFKKFTEELSLMQEEAKTKSQQVKSKENQLSNLNNEFSKLEDDIEGLMNEIEQKEKLVQRQRKTKELLSGSEDALEKVKKAVDSQIEKLLHLADQWEKHRGPLVDEIQSYLATVNVCVVFVCKFKFKVQYELNLSLILGSTCNKKGSN